MHYDHLSDDEVIAFIDVRRDNERRTVAEIVALLAVIEERRIHLARAFTSMFGFCLRGLGLTEKEAKRRIDAARIVSRFPQSFEVRLPRFRGQVDYAAFRFSRTAFS